MEEFKEKIKTTEMYYMIREHFDRESVDLMIEEVIDLVFETSHPPKLHQLKEIAKRFRNWNRAWNQYDKTNTNKPPSIDEFLLELYNEQIK